MAVSSLKRRSGFFLSFFFFWLLVLFYLLVWFRNDFLSVLLDLGFSFSLPASCFGSEDFLFFSKVRSPVPPVLHFESNFNSERYRVFLYFFFYRVYRFWPTDAAAVVVNDVSLKELVECFSNISLDLRRRQFLFGYRADFTVFAAQDFKELGLVFDQLMGLADEIGFKRIVFNLSTEYRNKLPRLGHCQGAFLG